MEVRWAFINEENDDDDMDNFINEEIDDDNMDIFNYRLLCRMLVY